MIDEPRTGLLLQQAWPPEAVEWARLNGYQSLRFPRVSQTRRRPYRGPLGEFLVELYVSRGDADAVESGAESARRAAAELTREGTPVRYLRSIFVPDDETCFFLYEAGNADDVIEATRRADLPFERIVVALAGRSAAECRWVGCEAEEGGSR